jgi:hypothetical protein
MIRRIINLFFFLFLASVHSKCKEPYQFDTSDQEGVLVVDGSISDMPGPYVLNLGTTTDAQNLPSAVIGAKAYITDDHGNSENYFEVGNGMYQLTGNVIQGIPGRSYTLHITLTNGKTYQSTAELMPTYLKPLDSLFFKVVDETTITNGVTIENWYVNLYLNTTFQQSGTEYFRWTVAEVYFVATTCPDSPPRAFGCPDVCYVYQPNTLYNLNVINRAGYSQNSINDILLISRGVDYSFDTRHYFNVTQFSMNASAYNYWKAVQQLITDIGTIFQTPPYTIKGNVSNINNANEVVVGYFEASGQKVIRRYIDRGSIPATIQSCSTSSDGFVPNTPFCQDCLILPGSTITQPAWW